MTSPTPESPTVPEGTRVTPSQGTHPHRPARTRCTRAGVALLALLRGPV